MMLNPIKYDQFISRFKYFKTTNPKLSLVDVLNVDICNPSEITKCAVFNVEDTRAAMLGLKHLKDWHAFSINKHPGLFVVRNPFTTLGQRFWIRKCLEDYPKKPHPINIDNEMDIINWWSECFATGKCNRLLQKKLRWTTLGYHHNWDTKIYSEENKSPFPVELAELTDVVAKYFSFTNFKAEAAIVNYYHMDSTLSAHTDHSEANLEAPLFSLSFGQSAIFLIGGQNKSVEPSAILLNSGDIVVMSKEARLSYHAVPKILPAPTTRPWENFDNIKVINSIDPNDLIYIKDSQSITSAMNDNINSSDWDNFQYYVQNSRINVNVRQVLNANQISLNVQSPTS